MSKWYDLLNKYNLAYLKEDAYLLSNVMEEIEKKNKNRIIEIELYLSIDNSKSILIYVGSLREIYEKLPLGIIVSNVDLVKKNISGRYMIFVNV